MTRIRLAAFAPTMCWIAPLMPQAMYRSGAMRVPVCPICCACGRQPRLVATRDTPTAAPSSAGQLIEHRERLGAARCHARRRPRPWRPPARPRSPAAMSRPTTRARRSASVIAGVDTRDGRGRRASARGTAAGDGVRRDRQEARSAVEDGVLEQAARPALARDPPRLARLGGDDVGRHRLAGPCGDMGQDLGRSIAPGRDDARRTTRHRRRAGDGRLPRPQERRRPVDRSRPDGPSRRRTRRAAAAGLGPGGVLAARDHDRVDAARRLVAPVRRRTRAPPRSAGRRRRRRSRPGPGCRSQDAELAQHLDDPWRRLRAVPEDLDVRLLFDGQLAAARGSGRRGALRRARSARSPSSWLGAGRGPTDSAAG